MRPMGDSNTRETEGMSSKDVPTCAYKNGMLIRLERDPV